MRTLYVRGIPEDLYQEIRKRAEECSHSLSAHVITMLTQALEIEKSRKTQTKALTSIRHRRFSPPKESPSSLDLLREDRK